MDPGTLPQWITASGILGFLGLFLRYLSTSNRLGNENTADIRQHYAAEVAALRTRIVEVEAHYRSMLKESEERNEECRKEREEDRNIIRGLKDELEGIKRQISRYSADKLMILEDSCALVNNAPESRTAARRVKAGGK